MKNLYPLLTSLIFLILLPNCEDLLTDEVTEEERIAAQILVDEANFAVFSDLGAMVDKGENIDEDEIITTPGTTLEDIVDLDNSYNKYQQALELDPENTGANFGVGFMVVAIASEDEELESTLNQWAECLDSLGMMGDERDSDEEESMSRSIINNNEYKLGVPRSGKAFFSFDAFRILDYLPIITSHKNILGRADEVCLEIESIQDLLDNVFLTRISTAISHLDKVVGTDFVFTITPEMFDELMDDPDQDPIDIDDTEIYLMKALMHQLRAMIYAIITYNVNVPYYDLIEHSSTENYTETRIGMPGIDYNWQWLAQDSDFLTIRSGQENSWPNAHADLNNVLNSIESAWTFLQGDTDTDSDIITMEMITDMEDEMEDEIDRNINEFLNEAREVLNEDYEAKLITGRTCTSYDQNNNWFEECEDTDSLEITLSIKNFLTSPPQNLKAIIPSYTIQTGICEYEKWNDETNNYEIIEWGCPEFSWVATDCESWKSGWDVTIGGLFPTMTPTKFFDELMELEDAEDCEDILNSGLDF